MYKVSIEHLTPQNPITRAGIELGACRKEDLSDPQANYERGLNAFISYQNPIKNFILIHILITDIDDEVSSIIKDFVHKAKRIEIDDRCILILSLHDFRKLYNMQCIENERVNHDFYNRFIAELCRQLALYSDEWKKVIKEYLIFDCDYFEFCPRNHSCGRHPIKQDIPSRITKLTDKIIDNE